MNQSLRKKLKYIRLNTVFWLGGPVVGLISILLVYLNDQASQFFNHVIAPHILLTFIIIPLAFMILAFITSRFFPGAEGSGVPQVMAALDAKSNRLNYLLSFRIGIGKFLSLLALMAGASLGREGPTLQIGAILMLSLPKLMRGNRQYYRSLIMAGAAAGIGSAFHAPLAGIIFAIECLGKRFRHQITSAMIATVTLSSVIGYFLLGHTALFGSLKADIDSLQGLLAIIVCSTIAGLLGGLFTLAFITIYQKMTSIPLSYRLGWVGVFGLIVASIGYLSAGHTYGSGHQETIAIIADHHYGALFPFYKLLANLFSSASTLPGGIFSPSLTVGAALGDVLAPLFPTVAPDAIILIAMVAFFCGVTKTPITCFAIVVEIAYIPSMTVPLIASALIANLASSLVCKKPFYDAIADMLLISYKE